MSERWIGVDLDGTLANYGEWISPGHIGLPVPRMVRRVKRWLKTGWRVKIMTARACDSEAIETIQHWCKKHIGQELEVTDRKDFHMIALFDDRAVAVEKNTGRILGINTSMKNLISSGGE